MRNERKKKEDRTEASSEKIQLSLLLLARRPPPPPLFSNASLRLSPLVFSLLALRDTLSSPQRASLSISSCGLWFKQRLLERENEPEQLEKRLGSLFHRRAGVVAALPGGMELKKKKKTLTSHADRGRVVVVPHGRSGVGRPVGRVVVGGGAELFVCRGREKEMMMMRVREREKERRRRCNGEKRKPSMVPLSLALLSRSLSFSVHCQAAGCRRVSRIDVGASFVSRERGVEERKREAGFSSSSRCSLKLRCFLH